MSFPRAPRPPEAPDELFPRDVRSADQKSYAAVRNSARAGRMK